MADHSYKLYNDAQLIKINFEQSLSNNISKMNKNWLERIRSWFLPSLCISLWKILPIVSKRSLDPMKCCCRKDSTNEHNSFWICLKSNKGSLRSTYPATEIIKNLKCHNENVVSEVGIKPSQSCHDLGWENFSFKFKLTLWLKWADVALLQCDFC